MSPQIVRMYWHDVIRDAISMYKRDGRLAMSVGDTGFGEEALRRSQLGILFYEKHWAIYEGWFWESYGTTSPVCVREREGVPLVTLYRRERSRDGHGADGASQPAGSGRRPRCEPAWLRCFRGWRGALIVYVVFAGAYLGAAGSRLRQPFALQPLRLSRGRVAARPPGAARSTAQRERLGEGRRVQAARRARAARQLRQPHGRADRSLLSPERQPETVPAGDIASRVDDSLRVVPAVPGRADGAVRRHLGAVVQRRHLDALWAGLNPMLLFLLLRHLRARGESRRSQVDDLWLTAMFGVGSVYTTAPSSVRSGSRPTIVAVTLSIGYVWASLGAGARCWRDCSLRWASRPVRPG